jgi:hypothetical protein
MFKIVRNRFSPLILRICPFSSSIVNAQIQKITLKELGQVLAFVEQQPLRKQRRKVGNNNPQIKHSKSSSNLSPIHESGLSNPSTPQLKNRYPQTRPCSWLSTSPQHNSSKSA